MIKNILKKLLLLCVKLFFHKENNFSDPPKPLLKKILIVSCVGIGNTILSIPLVIGVINNLNNFQIDILTNDSISYDILKRMNIVRNIYLLQKKPLNYLKTIMKLKRMHYQYCLVTFPSLSLPIEIIPILIKAGYIVIHDYRPFHSYFKYIYNKYYTLIPINTKLHDSKQNINLLTHIISSHKSDFQYPEFQLNKIDYKDLYYFKKRYDIIEKNKIVLIHPGSKEENSHKRWPITKYLMVAKKLMREKNIKVLFIIGPDEKEIIPILISKNIQYLDTIPIVQLMAIIKISALLISNDSGIMHLASLVNIPIIAIWGATNNSRNSAISQKTINVINNKISCRPCINIIPNNKRNCQNECIKDIDVNKVYLYAEKILHEISRKEQLHNDQET
jgi:ADP-heptose:LPS heptosyltransferase